MSRNLNELADELSALTVLEASELSKILEEKWGVSANMQQFATVSTNTATVEEPEQTEFDIILADIGAKKIEVIKIVREITSLNLKDAKDLTETSMALLKHAVSKTEAETIKAKFEAVGAKIEIR